MKTDKNVPETTIEILIVEDSPTQAGQLQYLLEKHGYKVLVAGNGKQALSLFSKHKSTLVISDIIMPDMNGYELCRQIKSDAGAGEVPVILLTSLSRPEDVLEGLACGADNFITKPYSEDYILLCISQLLANQKLRKGERIRMGIEIVFAGEKRFITADQQQMLTLLLSTYEAAVWKNTELIQAKKKLQSLNVQLEGLLKDKTKALQQIEKSTEAQRKSEERYRYLFNTMDEGFCIIKMIFDEKSEPSDYCFLEVNPAFEKQTGLCNAKGKLMRALAPAHEAHWFEIYGKIALTGEPVRFVNEAKALNRWFDVYAYRVGKPEDRQVAILFSDITEQKKNELALSGLNVSLELRADELALANKDLEAFSYSVSHDLRNPLNNIITNTHVLSMEIEAEPGSDSQTAMTHIIESAERMGRVIKDLLTLSGISRQKIKIEKVDLSNICQTFLSELMATSPQRKVRPNIQPGLILEADPGLFRILIENLVRNAWKFSSKQAIAQIDFGAFDKDGSRCFFIRDNGVGFEMKDAQRMFRPYERLHSTLEYKGSGIGLSIAKRIIEKHGGTIWAEGEKNKGATIYFHLS